MRIPGIPAGYENVRVEVSSNVTANAESVLRNSADVFDWADAIPGDLKPEIAHVAAGRYSTEVHASTYWFFLNTRSRPFSSRLAREAVIVGLDRPALSRLSGGTLVPACYYVPEGMVGHPTAACPYADPNSHGDLAKARALVKASGMAGTPVTVWGENSSPRRQWTDYYTDLLNRIGFRASERILNSAIYFPTVGDLKLDPQTGFVDWNQEFPDPLDFYLQLESSSILPSNNPNLGQIRDARIDAQVSSLAPVPPAGLAGVARDWQALDEYTARQAYLAVFGYRTFPAFTSNRIDRRALVFHPVYGWDWSSFRLK
jgi:peptide/nickel transport system substrate-binding protein